VGLPCRAVHGLIRYGPHWWRMILCAADVDPASGTLRMCSQHLQHCRAVESDYEDERVAQRMLRAQPPAVRLGDVEDDWVWEDPVSDPFALIDYQVECWSDGMDSSWSGGLDGCWANWGDNSQCLRPAEPSSATGLCAYHLKELRTAMPGKTKT
jgi:hypothetical protein